MGRIDWSKYEKCPTCSAKADEACIDKRVIGVDKPKDKPHDNRRVKR